MNKVRRVELAKVIEELGGLQERIEALREEEQEAFDAMPESLQNGDRGQANEAAVAALENSLTGLEEAVAALNEAAE